VASDVRAAWRLVLLPALSVVGVKLVWVTLALQP